MGLFSKEGGAIPLEGVEIEGEVLGGHARVRVRQKYRNTEKKPIEAVYTFPLPSRGTMIAFAMTCDGRRVEGQIREREQAFREYDDAITAGHGAALMEQERPNVFTASVGNLLPGEETLVDVEYLERLTGDEGALRLMIPTLVAPRYIPGAPAGDRTAHGAADPTDRVPDADRITPPIGDVKYGVKLDVKFDLGRAVEVESPSHRIVVSTVEGRTQVSFAEGEVALDRDIVLIASNATDQPLTSAVTHRDRDGKGAFALTVVPDLGGERAGAPRQDVVFVIDHSGSMGGASMGEAQAALRLCLRHLREGDRFNVIAFDDQFVSYKKSPVPFTQKTLEEADRWVAKLTADGGTEILAPMLSAMQQAPDGIVVLLTDGQVGNEEEILREVMGKRGRARIYPFGIGTNVSDWMLGELAKRSGGALEMIHPGERIDEKVVAQFARAIAPRVTDVSVKFDGIEVGELAPAEPPSLVDGEPWTVFGKLDSKSSGRIQVRGKLDGKPFLVEVPVDGSDESARPTVMKLWASERIRDLEMVAVTGRKKDAMKARIVALSVENGVLSSYTAFVCVETRTGDRRASGQPETRVVPVNAPAGWDMFKQKQAPSRTSTGAFQSLPVPMPMAAASAFGPMGGGAGAAPPAPRAKKARVMAKGGLLSGILGAFKRDEDGGGDELLDLAEASAPFERPEEREAKSRELTIMARQLASGLWDEGDSTADDEIRQLRATARALLELADLGITSTHALHGGPIKKAIEAIIKLAPKVAARDTATAELALGVAWLVASGRRTRKEIEAAVAGCVGKLQVWLGDERALRGHLDALAAP